MFETRAIHYRDQGEGGPPWDEIFDSGGSEQDGGRQPIWEDPDEHFEGGLYPDAGPAQDDVVRSEDEEKPFVPAEQREDPVPEEVPFPPVNPHQQKEELPIEERASEAEKIYANLLEKTDFDREFIEEMIEFEPDEESKLRIDELRRKRKEIENLSQSMVPPPMGPPQGPGIDMIMV